MNGQRFYIDKQRAKLAAFLVFCLAVCVNPTDSAGQTPAAQPPKDVGRQILTDTTLFPESVSGVFLRLVESFGDFGSEGLFGTPVSRPDAPLVSAIESKYGKPVRTDERKSSRTPGPPFDARCHWYGEFGYCIQIVPAESMTNRVEYVLWDRKKPK